MIIERSVSVEGKSYTVIISDEREALLAAKAAGRAIVELWRKDREGGFSPASYAIGDLEDADALFLERVVRRSLRLPWIIAETERLVIREFAQKDGEAVPKEERSGCFGEQADQIFYTPELLSSYIQCQYGFYEYGVWAVMEKESGKLVGKAGVWDWETEAGELGEQGFLFETPPLELGYHIFLPYRRMGYGKEAVLGILNYVRESIDGRPVIAKTDASNEASVQMLKALGFQFIGNKYSGSGRELRLYAENLIPRTDKPVPW